MNEVQATWFVVLQTQLPTTSDLYPSHTSNKPLLPLPCVTGFLHIFHPWVGHRVIARQSLSLEQDSLISEVVQNTCYQEQCWCNPGRDALIERGRHEQHTRKLWKSLLL